LPLESSTGGIARSMANLLERFEQISYAARGLSAEQQRQVLSLLALLVQKYNYRHVSSSAGPAVRARGALHAASAALYGTINVGS
jgi:hypothetical protein